MSNYNIHVEGIRLLTGTKYVRLILQMQDGDLSFTVMLPPQYAKALSLELGKAAAAAQSLIELPAEAPAGFKVES